jgi:hypothetical protein
MKQFVEKLFGIDKRKAEDVAAREVAIAAAESQAKQVAMSPKERATKLNEPWVSVIDTKVNPENIRNGFFELDWNDQFIAELIKAGYGEEADPQEEIVDRWFRTIVYDMLSEEGQSTNRGAGYINVASIGANRSEVS